MLFQFLSCSDDSPTAPKPNLLISSEKHKPIEPSILIPWMEYFNIPGASIAVVENDSIDWAQGYGVADNNTQAPVTIETIFQAASISKPFAAVTSLSVFEEHKIDIDSNVNEILKSWKIPNNEYTNNSVISLRLLLSHSAGFNVHGFGGYNQNSPLPQLLQILNGTAPANNEPIKVTISPGTIFKYSGGGYQVVQQVLEDLTKEEYPHLVQSIVFNKLGMESSSFLYPIDANKIASGHTSQGNVIDGKWNRYPELCAAGLWTTPIDLARFVIGLQRSYRGSSNNLLSSQNSNEMFTAQRRIDDSEDSIGLGVILASSGQTFYFKHSGSNYGFQCYFFGYLNTKFGLVIMTNSDNGEKLVQPLIDAVLEAY